MIELAGIALNQIEVRKHALDEMDRLCDEVNLLTNLAVLLDGDVLHLAHSAPKAVPRMYTALGRRAVAHCTSLGKALLAHRPWDETRGAIERHGWRPYTRHSIADFARLEAELAAVRAKGYAIDREERRADVICIAAPIRDRAGEVVAADQRQREQDPHDRGLPATDPSLRHRGRRPRVVPTRLPGQRRLPMTARPS